MGQVTVLVDSDVLESKFKKGTFYCMFKIDGVERHYQVENDACRAALAPLKGKIAVLQAFGSREQATLQVHGFQGAAAPAPTSAPPQNYPLTGLQTPPNQQASPAPAYQPPLPSAPPRVAAPVTPGRDGHAAVAEGRKFAARCANWYLLAGLAGDYARKWHDDHHGEGDQMTNEQHQAMVTSIYITGERNGLIQTMPTGLLDKFLTPPTE